MSTDTEYWEDQRYDDMEFLILQENKNMNTCFNCGQRYGIIHDSTEFNAQFEGFCSNICKTEDEARLAEGNGIITAAEKQEVGFTDINKLKLDVHAPAAAKAVSDMKSMLGFNRKEDDNV